MVSSKGKGYEMDILMEAFEYGVELERELATLTDLDREWAEMSAGRPVTDREVLEFKRDYEAWVEDVERVFGG